MWYDIVVMVVDNMDKCIWVIVWREREDIDPYLLIRGEHVALQTSELLRSKIIMHLSCSVDVFSNPFALKSSREDPFTNLLQQPSGCATMAALRHGPIILNRPNFGL